MWRNFDFIAAPRIEMHQSDCFFYLAFDQWKANGNIHMLPQRFALIMQLYNGGAKKKECLFHIVLIRKNNAEIFAFGISKPTGYIPNIINTFCLLFICSTVQFYIKTRSFLLWRRKLIILYSFKAEVIRGLFILYEYRIFFELIMEILQTFPACR